jgi:copper(I)-binding protein
MRLLIALTLAFLVAGCGSSELDAGDAWARSTPAVADTAAIYLMITNGSSSDQELVEARSDHCTSVELHETTMDGDVMEMNRLDALRVRPGETIRLEPGGLHLMCIGVRDPLTEGDAFTVTLESRAGQSLPVEVVVEDR